MNEIDVKQIAELLPDRVKDKDKIVRTIIESDDLEYLYATALTVLAIKDEYIAQRIGPEGTLESVFVVKDVIDDISGRIDFLKLVPANKEGVPIE